ncbi:MAG: hypothetical protein Q9195_002700 [Heterodermia aff. obscurata]
MEEVITSPQAVPDTTDTRTLIVTVFARAVRIPAEATPGSIHSFDFEDIKDSFTALLTRLAPFIQPPTLTHTFRTPAVIRLTYTLKLLPNDPIPPINTWASISSELPASSEIRTFETSHACETIFDLLPPSFPTPNLSNPRFRLAVFDMDSTLIDQEVIDELARSIGLTPAVSAITARAMNGEIDFATSLHERVRLLKGVRADIWASLRSDGSITIARGARELLSGLKAMGVTTAVVSGGFTPMAEWLQAQLGLDYAFANHLLTAPPDEVRPYEHLSGALDAGKPLIDAQQKKDILLRLAAEHGVPVEQTIAVGDGSNDLLMMHAAGMGIAFRAKEKVQREAPRRLNGDSLEEILYLFGSSGELEYASSKDNSKP